MLLIIQDQEYNLYLLMMISLCLLLPKMECYKLNLNKFILILLYNLLFNVSKIISKNIFCKINLSILSNINSKVIMFFWHNCHSKNSQAFLLLIIKLILAYTIKFKLLKIKIN